MKWTRRILIASLILTGAILALWWEENWRGQRIWEESCARLRAADEPVEIADIIPPMIPDEENVAAAPIFAELFSDPRSSRLSKIGEALPLTAGPFSASLNTGMTPGNMAAAEELRARLRERFPSSTPTTSLAVGDEILHYLGKWDTEYMEMRDALNRPKCRWPLDYEMGVQMDSSYLVVLFRVMGFMEARAVAFAAKGDTAQYTDTLLTMMKLERAVGSEPTSLLTAALASTMASSLFSTWQQTLACVRLDDTQLAALQKQAALYSLKGVEQALTNERVLGNHTFRSLSGAEMVSWLEQLGWMPQPRWKQTEAIEHAVFRAGMMLRPRGWTLAEAAMAQDFSITEESSVNVANGTFDLARFADNQAKGRALQESLSWFSMGRHCHNDGPIVIIFSGIAKAHATARLAAIWCALERHRLRHGNLPGSTAGLSPEWFGAVPHDPIGGKPFRYVRRGDSHYILYSIGWNEVDDGGVSDKEAAYGDWRWASSPDA